MCALTKRSIRSTAEISRLALPERECLLRYRVMWVSHGKRPGGKTYRVADSGILTDRTRLEGRHGVDVLNGRMISEEQVTAFMYKTYPFAAVAPANAEDLARPPL
jgi:hypothetical protein